MSSEESENQDRAYRTGAELLELETKLELEGTALLGRVPDELVEAVSGHLREMREARRGIVEHYKELCDVELRQLRADNNVERVLRNAVTRSEARVDVLLAVVEILVPNNDS